MSPTCVPGTRLSGVVVSAAVARTYSWLASLPSLSSIGSPPIPESPDCIKPELAVGMDSTLGWCQDADKLCFRLWLCVWGDWGVETEEGALRTDCTLG